MHLPTRRLGQRVLHFQELDSTNTLALAMADEPENDGVVVRADQQAGGRGQYGRTWTAPAQSSVLLSVLLFPPPRLRRPVLLTAWAAVAVCETVWRVAGMQAKIKWPNDILVQGKKVCGILIEQRNTGRAEQPLAAVAGIGLNVCQSAEWFAQAMLPQAGSLCSLSGAQLETQCVADALIGRLDEEYDRMLEGDTHTLEACWKWRVGLLGKVVKIELAHETRTGRLLEVAFDQVVVQTEDGERSQWTPEQIRHIDPA
ncbi:MAG: biotin--[acetyl-CoA-carboxylase] ligase [Gemmataceae bacterium]|nr:biotin--[acetyl-CoA-carboxylase] ligase [Gemmataceae bacterium]MCI0741137.1 biotin--[acetyl-CoA-carboxylase] ligase [Gemmataceae bacterium]